MCTARVQLVYGLWVTTASLRFSVAGLQSSAGARQAIKLISLRSRNGTLVNSDNTGYTPLASIPVEIWNLIRREVLLDAIQQAQYDTMDKLRCRECDSDAIEEFYEIHGDSETFAEDLKAFRMSMKDWIYPESERLCNLFVQRLLQSPLHRLAQPNVRDEMDEVS